MKAELVIKTGAQAGERFELSRLGSYSIGRRSDSDLPVADKAVSRKHCRIDCDGEFFWLVDCQSHNGTFVNGRKITKCLLYDGDVVKVGRTSMVFSLSDEESDETASR